MYICTTRECCTGKYIAKRFAETLITLQSGSIFLITENLNRMAPCHPAITVMFDFFIWGVEYLFEEYIIHVHITQMEENDLRLARLLRRVTVK
jgi:hypothetical protein